MMRFVVNIIMLPFFQIGYNARALTVPDDTDVGTAIVAAQLVNMNYMWQQIRMRVSETTRGTWGLLTL